MDGLQLENQFYVFRHLFDRHFWRSPLHEGSPPLRNKTRPVGMEFYVGCFQVGTYQNPLRIEIVLIIDFSIDCLLVIDFSIGCLLIIDFIIGCLLVIDFNVKDLNANVIFPSSFSALWGHFVLGPNFFTRSLITASIIPSAFLHSMTASPDFGHICSSSGKDTVVY